MELTADSHAHGAGVLCERPAWLTWADYDYGCDVKGVLCSAFWHIVLGVLCARRDVQGKLFKAGCARCAAKRATQGVLAACEQNSVHY